MKMQTLWQDIRFGLRTLANSPGFTLVALLTLALGIGANTAIFSAVNRILLHPLPFPQPDRIVAITKTGEMPRPDRLQRMTNGPAPAPAERQGQPGSVPRSELPQTQGLVRVPATREQRAVPALPPPSAPGKQLPHPVLRQGAKGPVRIETMPAAPAGPQPGPAPEGPIHMRAIEMGGGGGKRGGKLSMPVFSYPEFEDLRAHSDSFEEVAAYHEAQVTLTKRGEPTSLHGVVASASLFRLLRAKPLLGLLFTSQDDREGAGPVAMLGEQLWRDRFNADPAVIGKTVELNNEAYTITGVLPSSLRFPPFVPQAEVWIPLVSDPAAVIQQMRLKRGLNYLSIIGRLRPGITMERGNAELSTLANRLAMTYPEEEGIAITAAPLSQQLVKNFQLALLVLLAAVGLVLLIACVNVANLLLARATVRERELAVRLALGAGRAGIIRQMLVESLELALAGGAAGVFFAYFAVSAFVTHLPPMLQEFQGVTVSGPVLAFAALVSMGAGIVMGLLPALRLSDLRVHDVLKGSGGGMASPVARGRLRESLVVLEVALAVVLLAGAGLLLRSFGKLVSVPLGFEPQGVLMASVNLSAAGYKTPQEWRSFTSTALQRLRGQPGVLQAAVATSSPTSGMRMALTFSIPGRPESPDEVLVADFRAVSPGFFGLMHIPLLRGRAFLDTDTATAAHVCVVDQAFVARYFPNEDPLTKQLRTGMPPALCQIVGVVGNVVSDTLSKAPGPSIYVPFDQAPFFAPSFLVRGAGGPAAMVPILREQLYALNSALPVAPVEMTDLLSRSLAQQRFRTTLVTLFAILAILLAAVGISGVLGYSVSRRTREIGVRMALGATPREVLRLVVGEGFRLVAIGAVLGAVAALGLTRFMRTLLYGISPADPVTYVGVALVLLFVAFGACALPAFRAAQVDPTVALRYE
ncbi:MAG: ABC transporter permease [Acidobacteriota bacterium]|nr:ABC transporter permease [Acidobacteriota bacterium]